MPMSTDLVIDVRNLTRTFVVGDVEVRALRGVDLAVARGEFVAIMGSSGSGKSTLMSILGCLDPPSGGHYYLEGVDVAKLSEPELAKLRGERLGFVSATIADHIVFPTAVESKYPYDYYKLVSTIPAEQAFRPIADGGCSLVK